MNLQKIAINQKKYCKKIKLIIFLKIIITQLMFKNKFNKLMNKKFNKLSH